MKDHQRIHSSKRQDWQTPPPYVMAVHEVFQGPPDLDPASSAIANRTVQARVWWWIGGDWLSVPWFGRVYLNPPYGWRGRESSAKWWLSRLKNEYEAGNVSEGIALVNLAPEWQKELLQRYPACLVDHRIRFVNPDTGKPAGSPTHSNVFLYFGPNAQRFAEVFSRFGTVMVRYV